MPVLFTETTAGDCHTFDVIFLELDQFLPPAGSHCRIDYRREPIRGRPGGAPPAAAPSRNAVTRLACDTGNWPEQERAWQR